MFSVEWLPDALNELTDIWLQASDRDAVTAASHEIDQQLGRDPEEKGE